MPLFESSGCTSFDTYFLRHLKPKCNKRAHLEFIKCSLVLQNNPTMQLKYSIMIKHLIIAAAWALWILELSFNLIPPAPTMLHVYNYNYYYYYPFTPSRDACAAYFGNFCMCLSSNYAKRINRKTFTNMSFGNRFALAWLGCYFRCECKKLHEGSTATFERYLVVRFLIITSGRGKRTWLTATIISLSRRNKCKRWMGVCVWCRGAQRKLNFIIKLTRFTDLLRETL